MRTKTLRKVVDVLMYLSMSFLVGTGLLIQYRLVPGSRGGHGLTLFGMDRHEWGAYHLWVGIALIALVTVHVFLNFAFVRNVIASRRASVLAVLAVLGAAVTLFFVFVPIERSADEGRRYRNRPPAGDDAADDRANAGGYR